MQWIQDPRQRNVDNLNNVTREASRHFRNKSKAYLKNKIEELENNSKMKNIRDLYRSINDLKKGYQHRTIIVMDEKGDGLQSPTVLWLGGGTISPRYCMYMWLKMSGRQKYTQQNHYWLIQVPLKLSWLLER